MGAGGIQRVLKAFHPQSSEAEAASGHSGFPRVSKLLPEPSNPTPHHHPYPAPALNPGATSFRVRVDTLTGARGPRPLSDLSQTPPPQLQPR